jgi:hypothetical protein
MDNRGNQNGTMQPLDLAFAEGVPKLEEAMTWLNEKEKYVELLRGIPSKNRRRFENSDISEFVTQLLDSGIIEEAEKSHIRAWTKMFTLAEPYKGRYRLIIEPRDLNECWKKRFSTFRPPPNRRCQKPGSGRKQDFSSRLEVLLLSAKFVPRCSIFLRNQYCR